MTSEKRLMKHNGQPAGNKILPAPFSVRSHGVRAYRVRDSGVPGYEIWVLEPGGMGYSWRIVSNVL